MSAVQLVRVNQHIFVYNNIWSINAAYTFFLKKEKGKEKIYKTHSSGHETDSTAASLKMSLDDFFFLKTLLVMTRWYNVLQINNYNTT